MDDAEDAKFRLRNTLEAKMRSSFDLVQHALTTLSKEENLTREQKVLLQAVGRTIAEWHELNHKQRDVINLKTPPGVLVDLVDTERFVLQCGESPRGAPHGPAP